jgi:hypothetical protein
MNKLFFGLRCSLLLLLCALLACCSQEEEDLAPTAKLVPLDISAVIEGSGTRAYLHENGDGYFVEGDRITITIDGDKSGKSYIYEYNGNRYWNPIDDENRLLISSDAGYLHLIAEYGAADYSNLPISLTALKDNLIAYADVDFNDSKANFSFTHKACKLQIYIEGIEIVNITRCRIGVFDPSISEMEEAFIGEVSIEDYIMSYYPVEDGESTPLTTIYVPKTAEIMHIEINFMSDVSSQDKGYRIDLGQQLEENNSYKCYLR